MQAAFYYKDESCFFQIKFDKNEQNVDDFEVDFSIQNNVKIKDAKLLKETLHQLMSCFELPQKD